MKWKTILYVLMGITMINIAYAQGYGGIGCPYGNFPYGNCIIIPPQLQPSRGGGGAIESLPTPILMDFPLELPKVYYDVIVKVAKNVYEEKEIIKSTITIINKGDFPDNDAILIYYLFINNNTIIGGKEVFEEMPIGKNTLQREIRIPDGIFGRGLFIVEYKTISQSTIQVYDNFEVKKNKINTNLLILSLFLALAFIYFILITPIKLKIIKKIKIYKKSSIQKRN